MPYFEADYRVRVHNRLVIAALGFELRQCQRRLTSVPDLTAVPSGLWIGLPVASHKATHCKVVYLEFPVSLGDTGVDLF